MTPRVSVVLPTRNRAHTLMRAVRGVLAQTLADWELILVDDGSTDGTAGIRARLRDGLGPRYRETETGGAGVSRARNAGIAMAKAPYVAFLDSDDSWEAEKLGIQVAALDAAPAAAFCFSDFAEFGPDGRLLCAGHRISPELDTRPYPLLLSVRHNVVTTPSVIARRDSLEAEGGFDADMAICEDVDLWVRLARRGPVPIVRLPLALVDIRIPDRFPYAPYVRARAALYARAHARDPALRPLMRYLHAEMLEVYATVAALRRDRAALRTLQAAAPVPSRPTDLAKAMEDLARKLEQTEGGRP